MTVTLSAWALPLAATVCVWAWAFFWPWPQRRGDYDFTGAIVAVLRLFVATTVTLCAWLIWALLS